MPEPPMTEQLQNDLRKMVEITVAAATIGTVGLTAIAGFFILVS